MQRFQTKAFQDLFFEAVLFLGLSFLLLFNGSTANLVNPTFYRAGLALLTLAALGWLVARQRARTPLAVPLLVWVAVSVLVASLSIDPRRSFTQVGLMLVSIFLFAFTADLVARGRPAERVTRALLWIGLIVVAFGWLQVGQWYASWLRANPGRWLPDIVYRLPSANVIAMFINLVLVLALARLLHGSGRLAKVALAALALACAGLLFLTSSRGGWLGAAAGLVVLAALALRGGEIQWRAAWNFLRRRPHLLAFGGLASLLLLAAAGFLLYRQAVHPTHGPVATARSEYWPPAIHAFLRSPLTGTGQFTYSNAFLSANSVPPKMVYVHAHGTQFNILAEMGLAGALALAFLGISALLALYRAWIKTRGPGRGVIAGALAMLAAFCVHSLFDGFHLEPIGIWVVAVTLGAALAVSPPSPAFVTPRRPWGLLLLLLIWWGDVWLTAPLYQGVDLANSNRWSEAAAAFQQAVVRDPRSVIAHQQLALADSVLASQGQPARLTQAVQELETVTRLEPAFGLNHANLGALYLQQGDFSAARRQMEAAVRCAPDSSLFALNLGAAAEAQGDAPAARAAYRRALDLGQPAPAYFWRQTELRRAVSSDWLSAQPKAPLDIPALQAVVALRSSSSAARLRLASAYLQSNRLEDAGRQLDQAGLSYIESDNERLELAWLRAELTARRGDLSSAAKKGQAAFVDYLMQGLYGPGSFGRLYYASLVFRRPAMALELVPQLVTINLPDRWENRAEMIEFWYRTAGEAGSAEAMQQIILMNSPVVMDKINRKP